MAAEAPDPRTFKSWEDAFNYPIPVIRKLEAQLRSSANDNRERLRSLVGASYRDLLGTAERIVEMDDNMDEVDAILGRIGQGCNADLLQRLATNHSKLEIERRLRRTQCNTFASQLSMLQSCPAVILKHLKQDGSTLIAAKVLVLSRLLHKNLAQFPDTSSLLDKIRDHLGFLRRKLLGRIDRQFAFTSATIEQILQNMCAFSLASSSTPTDILKHFHHCRLEAIKSRFHEGFELRKHILDALTLYVRTLSDTQAIFPRLLSEALVKLKTCPLIQSRDVQSVAAFKLSIHERWVADEVRNYTPYPRHDELQKTESERIAKSWAKQAMTAFLNGIKEVLSSAQDLVAVSEIRRDILDTWLSSTRRAPGSSSNRILDDLREALNLQLGFLVRRKVDVLQVVGQKLADYVRDWTRDVVDVAPLWDLGSSQIDLGDGAAAFKDSVTKRSRGRSGAVQELIKSYQTWAEGINDIRRSIKTMRDMRWDDYLDDEDDEDLDFDSKQSLLGDDDAQQLEEVLSKSLAENFKQLGDSLNTTTKAIASAVEDRQARIVFLLRCLRDISQSMQTLDFKGAAQTVPTPITSSVIAQLHSQLALTVIPEPIERYEKHIQRLTRSKRCAGRALWEGTPQLPVQPSVSAYCFLRGVMESMSSVGADLWSQEAVKEIRMQLTEKVSQVLAMAVSDLDKEPGSPSAPTTNAFPTSIEKSLAISPPQQREDGIKLEEQTDETMSEQPLEIPEEKAASTSATTILDQSVKEKTERLRKDKTVQLAFDAHYFSNALSDGSDTLKNVAREALSLSLSSSDDAVICKHATEYWKKSYLLFALLV